VNFSGEIAGLKNYDIVVGLDFCLSTLHHIFPTLHLILRFIMAKSKPSKKDQKAKQNGSQQEVPIHMAGSLFEQATDLLQEGQPGHALPVAQKLIQCLSRGGIEAGLKLPALDLLGEIYVELGEPDDARNVFLEAVKLDPNGELDAGPTGGADKFLWLAQLCEEGGAESVKWFEQGAMTLRKELAKHDDNKTLTDEEEFILAVKRNKLANALCGAAEVYMTDLRCVS
jgi:tetratricopeptide (TPR) repeat protein